MSLSVERLPARPPAVSGGSPAAAVWGPPAAIAAVLGLLAGEGCIGNRQLSPELLRRAKFDERVAAAPLLAALHDTALVVAAGLPGSSEPAMRELRATLALEALEPGTGPPPEGVLWLLHCLASWDCPAGLVARLAAPMPSSRACLLALAWLVAHARLFERALTELALPPELEALLPPWPQDGCGMPEARARQVAAAAAARAHAQRVQAMVAAQAAAGASSSSTGAWRGVHAAAQQVLASYRGAAMRLQHLACLQDAREGLMVQLQAAQQGGGARGAAHRQLTGYELQLLASPAALAQHQGALEQACALLQQQAALAQHAATFFAWAAGVVDEEQGSPQAGQGATPQGGGPHHQASAADVLPLLAQLPRAQAPAAAHVLAKVLAQLQAAADGARLEQAAPGALHVELAALSLGASSRAGRQHAAAVAGFRAAAAAALVQAGQPPGPEPQLAQLPSDIQQRLVGQHAHARLQQQQPKQQPQQRHYERAAPAGERLQLAGLSLQVAKSLAKARSTNKTHLGVAAEVLLGEQPEGSGGGGLGLALFVS